MILHSLYSQDARAEMLLFELLGALFQFEAREPELDALFQLAPSSTASVCLHTLSALELLLPSTNHFTNLSEMHGGNLMLVAGNQLAVRLGRKSELPPERRQR